MVERGNINPHPKIKIGSASMQSLRMPHFQSNINNRTKPIQFEPSPPQPPHYNLSNEDDDHKKPNERIHLLKKRLIQSPSQMYLFLIKKEEARRRPINPPELSYPLAVLLENKLSQLDLKIKQLSNQSKRIQEMTNKAMNRKIPNTNVLKGTTNGTFNKFYSDYESNNKSTMFKLPPINSKQSQSLFDFSHDPNKLKANCKRSEREVDLIEADINKIDSEFDQKYRRIRGKQKLELEGINYILSKIAH